MSEKNDSGDGERYAWECYEELKAQLAQVTAERDRLRAALEEIELLYSLGGSTAEDLVDIAREALEGK